MCSSDLVTEVRMQRPGRRITAVDALQRHIFTAVNKKQPGTKHSLIRFDVLPPILSGSISVDRSFPINDHILHADTTDNGCVHGKRVALPAAGVILVCLVIALYDPGEDRTSFLLRKRFKLRAPG